MRDRREKRERGYRGPPPEVVEAKQPTVPSPKPERIKKREERARVFDEQERRAAVTPKVAEAYTPKEVEAQKEIKVRRKTSQELIGLAQAQKAKAQTQDVTINIRTRQTNRFKSDIQKQVDKTNAMAEDILANADKYTSESIKDFKSDLKSFNKQAEDAIQYADKVMNDLSKGKEVTKKGMQKIDAYIRLIQQTPERERLAVIKAEAAYPTPSKPVEETVSAPKFEIKELTEREIEEKLEKGELDPFQVSRYFREGKGKFVVSTEPEPIIGDPRGALQNLLSKVKDNRKEAGYVDYKNIDWSDPSNILGPGPGPRFWELSAKEKKARIEHAKRSAMLGLYVGAFGLVDPRTYTGLAKDVVGLVQDPSGSIKRRSSEIKSALQADPEGFMYTLTASLIGSYVVGKGLGRVYGAAKPGIKNVLTKTIDKAKTAGSKLSKTGKYALETTSSEFWKAVMGADKYDEFLQILKVDDGKFSLAFKKGPTNLWDEFRAYTHLRGKYVPPDPGITVTRTTWIDELMSYLKLRTDYVKSLPFDPKKIKFKVPAFWDEFLQTQKIEALPRTVTPSDLLINARIWWMLHQAKLEGNTKWVTAITGHIKKGTGKRTPWYKTGMGLKDMPWPSKAEQGKAIEFFKNLESEGVGSEVASYYCLLKQSGMSEEQARSLSGNYAVILTSIHMAKTTKDEKEAVDTINDALISVGYSMASYRTSLEKEMSMRMLEDIMERLKFESLNLTSPIFPELTKLTNELETRFITTGKVDQEQFDLLIAKLTTIFDIDKTDLSDLTRQSQLILPYIPQVSVEELIEGPKPPKILPIRSKDEKEMRKFRKKLFHGPKVKYRVEFHYRSKDKQSVTVEARSYPEALKKAQRVRRVTHELPNMVDLRRVK